VAVEKNRVKRLAFRVEWKEPQAGVMDVRGTELIPSKVCKMQFQTMAQVFFEKKWVPSAIRVERDPDTRRVWIFSQDVGGESPRTTPSIPEEW
jgi:hypothetical protein